MNWYQLTREQIEQRLHVHLDKGLTSKQVLERRTQYGKNILTAKEKQSILFLFLKQFQDFMVFILFAATFIAGLFGEYIDALAIMVIVLLNGIIGFFQEHKAEKSLEKLSELSSPKARVLREGTWETITSEDVVVGDVIRFKSGDRLVADVRILKADHLETEESMLTGESIPITKTSEALLTSNVPMQDQRNIAFKGTLVTKGSGIGIVINTGMNTAIGKIASLMEKTKKMMTPLEMKLVELGKVLIIVVLFLTALTVAIGIFHGQPLYDMVLAGISLAVAVIPEGLPAIVTVVLSLGVQRMIKHRAIVRELSAVETLGATTVICTDKTGTITENKMTVKEIYVNKETIQVTGEGHSIAGDFYVRHKKIHANYPNLEHILLYGMLCNEANLYKKHGVYKVEGDPTDGALLIAARKFGIKEHIAQSYNIIKRYPFDSTEKRMTVVVEDEQKNRIVISKGAPEQILPRCSYQMLSFDKEYLTDTKEIETTLEKMAEQALRVIAISIKFIEKDEKLNRFQLEKDHIFLGLFGLEDPPRKEVKQAIFECKQAGIKTVMITGDHVTTAKKIAQQVGLLDKDSLTLEGKDIASMPVKELATIIDHVAVFARVSPEDKLKIVQAFQRNGHIVAMTGDGVNDAPAIKAANIGISMGTSGTDVAKEASSFILMDDNFHTIKEAIREGRNIYENIRKFIRYLLASNVGEIFIMLAAMLLALPLPLIPVQILWVNLVTDGLPAMALGVDSPEKEVMTQKPRDPKEGIFARGLGTKIITRGLLIGLVSLTAFLVTYDADLNNLDYARTVTFSTLVISQLIHVFDCRSEHGIFQRNPFSNKYLVLAVLSSVFMLIFVLYVEELQVIFQTVSLKLNDWLLILGLSFIPSVLFGITKTK